MSNRIHIIVKREPGDYWAAYCLDFTLYAVGDTADEARQKLLDIVSEYVEDATTGADRDYRDQLLGRRAPLRDWAVFFALRAWYRYLEGISRSFFFTCFVAIANFKLTHSV